MHAKLTKIPYATSYSTPPHSNNQNAQKDYVEHHFPHFKRHLTMQEDMRGGFLPSTTNRAT